MQKPVRLLSGERSLFFIVCESKKGTVYAGDWDNDKLVVIP